MTKEFQREWNTDFDSQTKTDPPNVSSNASSTAGVKIVHGSKIVIDDILLYPTNVFTLIHYFSCVARVFTRYRLFFLT